MAIRNPRCYFGNLSFSKIGVILAVSNTNLENGDGKNSRKSVKRPRGRPQVRCDEDTRQLIIEAAAKEFQAKGYAATCIGEVAQ
jgi:hypothetical protein